jgi:hypothetical protein
MLMREPSRAEARWSGVPTVVQRRCCGGATRRGVLGFGGAAKDRDRNAGGVRGFYLWGGRTLGVQAQRGEIAGDLGLRRGRWCEGEKKGEGEGTLPGGAEETERERERSAGWVERWRGGGGLAAGPSVAHAGKKGKEGSGLAQGVWLLPFLFPFSSFLFLLFFFFLYSNNSNTTI